MGLDVSYFKPAQTGVSGPQDPMGDAAFVLSENQHCSLRTRTGFSFPDPIDPMTAAQRAGVSLSREDILETLIDLSMESDISVIEGAGGVCSPFFPDGDGLLSVFDQVEWPFHTILVSHPHIGTLSQTLLAVQYLKTHLAGTLSLALVPRPIDDDYPLASSVNPGTLCRLLSGTDIFILKNNRFSKVFDGQGDLGGGG
jgi:dethiobiotin synthetase